MLDFLSRNIGTIAVLFVVAAVVGLVVFKMMRDKRKGKSSCGCNCGCCPNSQLCHKEQEK